jgi:hypothetical protein
MDGYNAGFDDCSGDSDSEGAEDEDSNDSIEDEEPSPSISSRPATGGTDWTNICSTVQVALYSSCSELVDDDRSLTSEGERALRCIRNGALLGGGAVMFGAPPGLVTRGLDILAAPTGCNGIVKMDMLNTIGGLGSILNLLP